MGKSLCDKVPFCKSGHISYTKNSTRSISAIYPVALPQLLSIYTYMKALVNTSKPDSQQKIPLKIEKIIGSILGRTEGTFGLGNI